MDRETYIKLKEYCQSIIEKPFPLESQMNIRHGNCIWCRDWELIEILKYLFNGQEAYIADPPPRRLKDNPLWNKEDIMAFGEALLKECKNTDQIIDVLKARRGT